MDTDIGGADVRGATDWEATLEVRQLRAFLAVTSAGTMSGAAAMLGLAQSTVSEAIAALDRAIGTATITRRRGTRRIVLTEAGAALLPHAHRVFQEIQSAQRAVTTVARPTSTSVTFTANESVGTYLLASALVDLRMRWPATRFSVSVAACANVRAEVAQGKCDAGFILEDDSVPAVIDAQPGIVEAGNSELAVGVTRGTPLVIFSGAKHPLARRRRPAALPLDSVAPFRIFVSEEAGDIHEMLTKYFATEKIPRPMFESVASINDVRRAVRNDPTTLGILPSYAITEDMESGSFREIRVAPEPPRVRLVALFPRAAGKRHPAIADLLEVLRCA